jgi:protein ImuA
MNKYVSDSAAVPRGLPVVDHCGDDLSGTIWGHALARMRAADAGGEAATASLAQVLTQDTPANALHEIFAASRGDNASASGFALMLAVMLTADTAPLFLVRPYRRGGGRLYPPGLSDLGIDPARCFSIDAPDTLSALKAAADIARSGAAGAVLIEIEGSPRLLDLTASRRLSLAAEKSGTAVLLLRLGAREAASAAYSRWQVASAQSVPLLADAPGGPAFTATLLRHRRMAAGQSARLIWNPEKRKFDEQAIPIQPEDRAGEALFGRLFSLATRRALDPHARRAA